MSQNPAGPLIINRMIFHHSLCYKHMARGLGSACAGDTDYHPLKRGDNINTTCILYLVQLKKMQLTRKLGQLQEKLSEPKAMVLLPHRT